MARYPDISDHGLIGDLQTAALVSTDGTDRLVLLPTLRLAEHLRVDPGRRRRRALPGDAGPDEYTTKQLYLADTAVLVTRFLTEAGVGEVLDFMPID